MLHFHPLLNQYKVADHRESEIATRNIPEDGIFEDPITKTVPIGWRKGKGKASKQQEYMTSTENEEFWKVFSYDETNPDTAGGESRITGVRNMPGENRTDVSEGVDKSTSGAGTETTGSLAQDELSSLRTFKSSTDSIRAHHVEKEQHLRCRIHTAIERMPENRKKTLEFCEANRRKRWDVWLSEVLKNNLDTHACTSQTARTGTQASIPVEFPVGITIDEQNNPAVNLRLYTECIVHGGVNFDAPPPQPELPDDIKQLIVLLNQSLPSAVEIGGVSTIPITQSDHDAPRSDSSSQTKPSPHEHTPPAEVQSKRSSQAEDRINPGKGPPPTSNSSSWRKQMPKWHRR